MTVGWCVKYVLLLCCIATMLLMGNAAALAELEWKPDREARGAMTCRLIWPLPPKALQQKCKPID